MGPFKLTAANRRWQAECEVISYAAFGSNDFTSPPT